MMKRKIRVMVSKKENCDGINRNAIKQKRCDGVESCRGKERCDGVKERCRGEKLAVDEAHRQKKITL